MDRHILIVEDDAPLRDTIADVLRPDADRLTPVGTAHDAWEALGASPSLIVLDLGLPDDDGAALCRRIRARDASTPILVLSARDGEDDKVRLLEDGADDYVTKPFAPAELRARVRALLRRAGGMGVPPGQVLRIGPVTIDLWRRRATRDGVEQRLTPIEWRLLEYFTAHPREALSPKVLFTHVWEREFGDAALHVRVRITYLRRKLEPDPAHPRLLVTVPGIGYAFHPPA